MDPIQRHFDAKLLDCNLGSGPGSFAFVHELKASTRALLNQNEAT